jgi:hypothetical protein
MVNSGAGIAYSGEGARACGGGARLRMRSAAACSVGRNEREQGRRMRRGGCRRGGRGAGAIGHHPTSVAGVRPPRGGRSLSAVTTVHGADQAGFGRGPRKEAGGPV